MAAEHSTNEALYQCGECYEDIVIVPGKVVLRCVECGGRVFYKKRSKIPTVFQAI